MLSVDTKITTQFPIFAQRFIHYKIIFSNGKPVATNSPLNYEWDEITKDFAPTLLWSIEPFTAKFWGISFPELGDRIVVSLNTDDSTAVLYYRITGTSLWKPWILNRLLPRRQLVAALEAITNFSSPAQQIQTPQLDRSPSLLSTHPVTLLPHLQFQ